jgi:hypothetical protein
VRSGRSGRELMREMRRDWIQRRRRASEARHKIPTKSVPSI